MNEFFKTLMRPDREENPEKSVVAQAANILQVGEFQVLQLAYHEWYGQEMPDYMSDRIFRTYMLRNQVPDWAREYAARIIRQDDIGLIDSCDAAYHRYDQDYVTHVPQGVRQFTYACMILASVFVVGLLVGKTAEIEVTSILPPYFEAGELNRGP